MYPMQLFCTSATTYLPVAGLSSRSRMRGTQGGRVYPRRKLRPRPDSMARALGVQSRPIWQLFAGSRSAEPEPCRTMENPHFSFSLLRFGSAVVQPRSYGTTLASSVPRWYMRGWKKITIVWNKLSVAVRVCECARVCAFMCVLALGRASFGMIFCFWY